ERDLAGVADAVPFVEVEEVPEVLPHAAEDDHTIPVLEPVRPRPSSPAAKKIDPRERERRQLLERTGGLLGGIPGLVVGGVFGIATAGLTHTPLVFSIALWGLGGALLGYLAG